MGWQILSNGSVTQGLRYRFVVQQPTSGSWSGDVQGSLQSDWAFDLVGSSFELFQIGSTGTWVAQAVASRTWTVPLSPQTIGGFTYVIFATQARDDLTRLANTGSSYTFDVRVPSSWTSMQTSTYLHGKGWTVSQIVAVSDMTSLLAGLPDDVSTTTAFSVAATWTGANATALPDSDGTISYGAFSGQSLASTVPVSTLPATVGATASSSSTAWIVGLGVVAVAGLGAVLLLRSKPAKNPTGVFIYDTDALDKLAELEGQRWLQDDQRMWQKYRSGNTAHAFQFAWWETHKPGVLGPQDLPFWKDYFAGDMGIELGIIYGDGGYARFAVRDDGEIVLEASSTRAEKVERAEQLGFRVAK